VDWAARILAEYPDLNIVGEEWSVEPPIVAYWQTGKENHDGYASALPSLFDFPLQKALADALTADEKPWGSVWTPVYETLSLDHLYPNPFNLVTFVDNHDMSRLYTVLGNDDRRLRMALLLIATMRGIPQVFYGTEINMSHPGTDSHGAIRSDFPGGWPDDTVDAFTGRGLPARDAEMQSFVSRLFNWRKAARVVHHGRLMQFAPKRQVYVFARYDDENVVLAAFNRSDEAAVFEAERYADVLRGRRMATDVMSGRRVDIGQRIELPAMSGVLLEVEN
ncbi:MAG: cyclomaltodextrinase C-terminal domain-containing protein, partial [Pseudomonadota bacterium]